MITFVRFSDIEAYNREYIRPAHAILTRHGGVALAVSDDIKVIEGNIPEGRTVLVEFPSMDAAEAFYNDPEYQPLKAIRHKYTECDSGIIEKSLVV